MPSPRPPSLATACSRAHARLPRTITTSLPARAGFGKYLNIKFNTKYQIMGAEVQTFLLEKSRVVSTTARGERNYHLFYYVLKGSGILPSTEPTDFRLLNRSQCVTIPRVDDLEEHQVRARRHTSARASSVH